MRVKLGVVGELVLELAVRRFDPVMIAAISHQVEGEDRVRDRTLPEVAPVSAGRERPHHRLPARAAERLEAPRAEVASLVFAQ